MGSKLLEVQGLKTYFFTRWGTVKAVDDITFSIDEGETLGLIGESGCGKSMTALSIVRLVPRPVGRIVGGKVMLEGKDLLAVSEGQMRRIRGKKIAMILQDPMTSLNPVFTIGNQIREAITAHIRLSSRSTQEKSISLLSLLRIPSPKERMKNYPHELSGGMRQRVVGAIALGGEPKLIIADEPTTSLDVTIQAQYLALLKQIQEQSRTALLFITHDFGVVAAMCNRVAVMYAGKIVEMATLRELYAQPLHPYTAALTRCVPKVEERVGRLQSIDGEPPALHAIPPGCSFAPRCAARKEECGRRSPILRDVGNGHTVACLAYE